MLTDLLAPRRQTGLNLQTGAVVLNTVTHRTRAATLRMRFSGLANATRTLTLSVTRDGVVIGQPVTLSHGSARTAAEESVVIPDLPPGAWAFTITSSAADTSATVEAELVADGLPAIPRDTSRTVSGVIGRFLYGASCASAMLDSYIVTGSPDRTTLIQAMYAAGASARWRQRGISQVFGITHPIASQLAFGALYAGRGAAVAPGATFPGSSGLRNRLPSSVEGVWSFASNQTDFADLQHNVLHDNGKVPYDAASRVARLSQLGGAIASAEFGNVLHRTPNSLALAYNLLFRAGASGNYAVITPTLNPAAEFRALRSHYSAAIAGTGDVSSAVAIADGNDTGREVFAIGAGWRRTDVTAGVVWGTELGGAGWGVRQIAFDPTGYNPGGLGVYTDDQLDAFFAAHAFEPIDTILFHGTTNDAGLSSADCRQALRIGIERLVRIGQRYTERPFGVILLTPMPWRDGAGTDMTGAMAARRDDMVAVAAEFARPDIVQVADVHQAMIDTAGPLASWEATVLVNEVLQGPTTRLHVQRNETAAALWGNAIHLAMDRATGAAPISGAVLETRTRLTDSRLGKIDGAAQEATLTPKASQASLDTIANPKLAVTLRTLGTALVADITAAGEAISLYSLAIRPLQAGSGGGIQATLTAGASVSPTQTLVTATFAGSASLITQDLDIVVSATTTQSGALPQRRIPWKPSEVAAGNAIVLAAVEGIEVGGGGAPVKPVVVQRGQVWRFEPRTGYRAKDVVSVPVGFAGWLAFEPILSEGASVAGISGVTIGGSSTGITEPGPSGDHQQAVFKTAARTTAGTYAVAATITTTDGQTLPHSATLVVG